MTDDQRWDTMDVMPAVTQRVGGEGVDFANSFVTTALCCPSRSSFFTGQKASTTGVRGTRPDDPFPGGAPLFDTSASFINELRAVGYRTGLFGKYLNATDLLEEVPPGWDRWEAFVGDGFNLPGYLLNEHGEIVEYSGEDQDYSTDLLRDRSLGFVEEHAESPFLVVYTPYAPHFDQGFFSTTPAPRHEGAFAGIAPYRPPSFQLAHPGTSPPFVFAGNHVYFDSLVALGVHDRWRQLQLESLLAVDEAVAALLDRLDTLAIADHTLVIFTSDNGYLWFEHYLTGKNHAYEESIRVPLMLRYPMLEISGHIEDRIALNIDLAPTILDAAGLAVPSRMDGESLLPLLSGENAEGDDAVDWRTDFLGEHWVLAPNFVTIFPNSTHAYVRTERWKYVRHTDPPFEELYDLANDPYELRNLAISPGNGGLILYALSLRLDELLAE
jgi:arylsulfatase A-like enzyme